MGLTRTEIYNGQLDIRISVLQYYSMTALLVSKRGTITLPPKIRHKLGLDRLSHPMVMIEEREGGLFIQPAAPVPVRDFPKAKMLKWIKDDEEAMPKQRKGKH
ncbi:MAG: AbrB/MazE/SpoVT family DNA-binding domain-containing protein [Verrucomicrobiae bacterium]|nr:AbrB/MazE/SpoVT family DNA-binding domain-containing protein [Verrucomicrobiae bacterium]